MTTDKNPNLQPTSSELAILQILWQRGPSTVRDVHDLLAQEKDIRYTTTLKTMQVMHARGFVQREIEGQNHTYEAAVAQEATQTALLDTFLQRAFGGSALRLVMKALGNYEASPEELEQLKKVITQKENENQKDHD
ncbi:BlaI/MecI/CopY family transcriptional regulator [Pontibacter toksunensis]|uniref:BlaI/MecI/CopY family transcriptional regulator n=1 Tax=Pontibacter toksunensis TaxID=1332631 RepID=A0ABW6C0B3_9BACT